MPTVSHRRASLFLLIAFAICALVCSLCLSACSSGAHQVIAPTEACEKCHSDQKTTFDIAAPAGALSVAGSTVTVTTSADQVEVCKPLFTSEDGSRFVPVRQSSVKVVDHVAEVNLTDGIWAICIESNDSSVGKVVIVGAGGSDEPALTL